MISRTKYVLSLSFSYSKLSASPESIYSSSVVNCVYTIGTP